MLSAEELAAIRERIPEARRLGHSICLGPDEADALLADRDALAATVRELVFALGDVVSRTDIGGCGSCGICFMCRAHAAISEADKWRPR